jgi:arylsulfatase A-like enzyme
LKARVLLVLFALFACACPQNPEPQKTVLSPHSAGNGENVLLITIDTLRADHLGIYGYKRKTSPSIDAFAAGGMVFDQAYTFWPKTRGSFAMIMTGRRPSQNGYSKQNQEVLSFNPTLASTLKDAGYLTHAVVDNANVSREWGYAKGFDTYRETWKEIKEPAREADRARLITEDAVKVLLAPPLGRPLFLWVHYVDPHGPYTPPPPYDTRFLDPDSHRGPVLRPVKGFHDGVREEWAQPGKNLGYYVAQYDGEIAFADEQVGVVLAALGQSPLASNTVVVLASDHGESLGEHGYYFDHGEDLHDPCLRVPLLVRLPGGKPGRTSALASTLDLLPTILDAVKVSYPPDLAGRSLLPEMSGRGGRAPERLFAQNERNLAATFDSRMKLVATPTGEATWRFALFDRQVDPLELHDLGTAQGDLVRVPRRELEIFWESGEHEWAATRRLIDPRIPATAISPETCEQMKAMGYVDHCP